MRPEWRIVGLAFLGAALLFAPGCFRRKKKDPNLLSSRDATTDEERFRRGYAMDEARKGWNAIEKGSKDTAINHFERAVRLDPAEPVYPLTIGQLYLELDRLDRAEGALQAALRALKAIHPETPADIAAHRSIQAEVHLASGDLLRKRGLASEAISAYQLAVEAAPGMARAHFELGNLFLERQRPAAAVGRFREALRIDPSMLRAQVGLVIAYHLGGENALAWREIQELERKGFDVNTELRENVRRATNAPPNFG